MLSQLLLLMLQLQGGVAETLPEEVFSSRTRPTWLTRL